MGNPPDLGAMMKSLGGKATGKPASLATSAAITDTLDTSKKHSGVEAFGSKPAEAPSSESDFSVSPPSEPPSATGQREAERLQILTRAPLYQLAEKRWVEKLLMKLQVPGQHAAKKLGFGPWKKRYASRLGLIDALNTHIAPVFLKVWPMPLPQLGGEESAERFTAPFELMSGAPPLHEVYAREQAHFGLLLNQDDIKHVCHAYLMFLAHAWFRVVVAHRRTDGIAAAAEKLGLPAEHVYVLEVNMCQLYVSAGSSAYFEAQPMRALAREIANGFRKLAFGGQ